MVRHRVEGRCSARGESEELRPWRLGHDGAPGRLFEYDVRVGTPDAKRTHARTKRRWGIEANELTIDIEWGVIEANPGIGPIKM